MCLHHSMCLDESFGQVAGSNASLTASYCSSEEEEHLKLSKIKSCSWFWDSTFGSSVCSKKSQVGAALLVMEETANHLI